MGKLCNKYVKEFAVLASLLVLGGCQPAEEEANMSTEADVISQASPTIEDISGEALEVVKTPFSTTESMLHTVVQF